MTKPVKLSATVALLALGVLLSGPANDPPVSGDSTGGRAWAAGTGR